MANESRQQYKQPYPLVLIFEEDRVSINGGPWRSYTAPFLVGKKAALDPPERVTRPQPQDPPDPPKKDPDGCVQECRNGTWQWKCTFGGIETFHDTGVGCP
jgi:hypothetical protein